MSSTFWILALCLCLVSVAGVVYPLLRQRKTGEIDYSDSNLSIYRNKLKELESDLEEGRIDKEHFDAASAELDKELLNDVPTAESASAPISERSSWHLGLALSIALFIPVFAWLVYQDLGMDQDAARQIASGPEAEKQSQIRTMVSALAKELNKNGGSVDEWALLGRSYKHIKLYQESADAFAEAIKIAPTTRLYLERAEALALLNGQMFVGEARDDVMKALEMSPNNVNALWFAGVAEFQSENYGESIDLLVRLSAEARDDAEIDQSIRFYISAAREKLISTGVDVPPIDELLKVDMTRVAKSSGASLEVIVDIEDDVRKRFGKDAVVFVFAKAQQGPKMPLAAQRLSVGELPKTIILDDSMAMVDGMNLSSFTSVVVSARVSRSGTAIAEKGDYIGSIKVDDVMNAGRLNVTIRDEI